MIAVLSILLQNDTCICTICEKMNKCEFHFKTQKRTRINLVFFSSSYRIKCSKQSIYAALIKRTKSLISYHVTFYPNTTKMTVELYLRIKFKGNIDFMRILVGCKCIQ